MWLIAVATAAVLVLGGRDKVAWLALLVVVWLIARSRREHFGTSNWFAVENKAFPYVLPPWETPVGLENAVSGDLELANMYRRLHNIDHLQRAEVFQFNDAVAGGDHGSSRERILGEAGGRAMGRTQRLIREDIAAKRRPPNDPYDMPTKPLVGTYLECTTFGDCQAGADARGEFLGLPSQPGVHHGYF